MTSIAAFISDHGFGHAARSTAVLKKLLARDCEIIVVSAVPEWFFAEKFAEYGLHWRYLNLRVDVGLAQISGVESDYAASVVALHEHWDKMDATLHSLIPELSRFKPDAVYFDIAAMGVLVAEKLGVPAIGMGNFSWDWIYDDLINGDCNYAKNVVSQSERLEFARFRELHREIYSKSHALMTLPYSGNFSSFTCTHYQLPWVGNYATYDRATVLERLGLNPDKKFALYSFGGHDIPAMNVLDWFLPDDWNVLVVGHDFKSTDNGVLSFTNAVIREVGVGYTDIVAAVDVVVTKPGYGIVTDCIFNKTPILHVERGQFAEYPLLLHAMDENLPHRKITLLQAASGNIFPDAEELLALKVDPVFPLNGAEVAAAKIIEFITV